jgi:hypothetical protein
LFKRVLVIIFIAAAGMIGLLGVLPVAAQQASATRSFESGTVAPGGQVVVTIAATNFGSSGGVTEELPPGFAYVSSSLPDSQVAELSGNRVRFTFLPADSPFTYTVTASGTADTYPFSGTLRDFERNDIPVGGADMVTVEVEAVSASSWRRPAPPGHLSRAPWRRGGR